MLQQGIQLLERFCQDDRVQIRQPRRNLQIKFTRAVSETNDFVAYVDAIGYLDGTGSLLEWKTTSSRYPEEPNGLLALDPQLVCYSWMTGIAEVAQVVFVRKRLVEVQYFRTTITDEQRQEFGRLVEDTIGRIESAEFLAHSGIRIPQNPCSSCPYLGLCLGRQDLVDIALTRRPGAEDLGWLHKARSLPKEQFKREVEKELTGRETEPWEIIYFKLYKTQIPLIEQAIETAALMLGTDKSRGYCLEMICADFLAGANLDNGCPDVLLHSISRCFSFLPAEQQQAFVAHVLEKAS
jgi:hypothetical protein